MSKLGDKFLPRAQALNDIVSRGPFSRIIQLDTYIDGDFLESYLGYGVIGPPTGSTGYFRREGRSLTPDLELLVVTPIRPHSLSNRAVIATASETILMGVSSHKSRWFTVDGQEGFSLKIRTR